MAPHFHLGWFRFPRRPRLQYGLKSLLLAMLFVCLALGWYVERVRRQQQGVAALTGAGAYVYYGESDDDPFAAESVIEEPTTWSEWLEFHTPRQLRDALGIDFFRRVNGVQIDVGGADPLVLSRLRDLAAIHNLMLDGPLDDDLVHVENLHSLTDLDLQNSHITDAGLVHLAGLQQLERLILGGTKIADAGLAHLASLHKLTYLDLHRTDISDAGIAHLADMLNLEALDLSGTRITDAGLSGLSRLRRLTDLNLSDTAVGDAGLRVVGAMPQLEFLNLQRTMVTDDGLTALCSLASLNDIRLSTTAITDKSVAILEKLSSLAHVRIDGTAVTPARAEALRRGRSVGIFYASPLNFSVDALTHNRIQLLMRVGRWSDALRETGNYQYARFDYPDVLFNCGRCRAEMGQWDEAEREYREALDELAATPSEEHEYADVPWHEISAWPRLAERLGRAFPDCYWRWIASARRAVLAGQWSIAIDDYARATKCRHPTDPNCDFEYALSRLLAGDFDEQRRVCRQFFEADQRLLAQIAFADVRRDWEVATHLGILAPQGEVDASLINAWRRDRASSCWARAGLETLALCRAAMFAESLRSEPPYYDNKTGRYWFARALAQHHLGEESEARQSLARGTRWLDRRLRGDRVSRCYRDAPVLLEAEILRREARRLIVSASE